jgi:hypothetical protein
MGNTSKKQSWELKQEMKDDIGQVQYIANGIKYHFKNIKSLYSRLDELVLQGRFDLYPHEVVDVINHEMVAYINRVGQFYYFAKSPRVRSLIPNPLYDLECIKKIMIFRSKQTAHRATDVPRNDDINYNIEELNKDFSLGGMLWENRLIFAVYTVNGSAPIRFDPLTEHDKVMQEIDNFFKKLHSAIHEEDSEILTGGLCKWLINELYIVMYFAEGDSRLDVLLARCKYKEEEVRYVIDHLIVIDWISMINSEKKTYFIRRDKSREIENKNFIKYEIRELVLQNKNRILQATYLAEEQQSVDFTCNLLGINGLEKDFSSFSFAREDLAVGGIDFISFYKEDLKDEGYLSKDYRLSELGRSKARQLQRTMN